MSYTRTPVDQKAAVMLFHAMLGIATLDGMEEAGQTVVAELQERGYLQPVNASGRKFAYNFKARVRKEALDGELLDYRLAKLDTALDGAYENIADISDTLNAYVSVLNAE